MAARPTQPFDPNLGQPEPDKKIRRPIKSQQEMRRANQARRQASRSPGGFAEGGTVENYNDQVKRKYGGGKL